MPRTLVPVLLVLLGLGVLVGLGGAVRAEPVGAVALLPLDAARPLELYGQPVASEIARALVAGGIDVVVVGPRAAVPERARLIIDGTIAAARAEAVVLTVRIRNRSDGTVAATMTANAAGLATIDQAAAELAARVLPAVRARLEELRTPAPPPVVEVAPPVVAPPVAAPVAARPEVRFVVTGGGAGAPLVAALGPAVEDWIVANGASAVVLPAAERAAPLATHTRAGGPWAIALDVRGYRSGLVRGVPVARARVHVRIAQAGAVVFDRVVDTDSIIGERQPDAAALAARTAREVLWILRPHVRARVTSWR